MNKIGMMAPVSKSLYSVLPNHKYYNIEKMCLFFTGAYTVLVIFGPSGSKGKKPNTNKKQRQP